MTTFTFNPDHFRTLHADVLEGKTAELTKANGAQMIITGDFDPCGRFVYTIGIRTAPGDTAMMFADVFDSSDLRNFLTGETFTQYESKN